MKNFIAVKIVPSLLVKHKWAASGLGSSRVTGLGDSTCIWGEAMLICSRVEK